MRRNWLQRISIDWFDQLLLSLLWKLAGLCSRFYSENKLNSKFLEGALGSENWKQLGAGKLLVNGCEAAVLPVASLRAPLQAF